MGNDLSVAPDDAARYWADQAERFDEAPTTELPRTSVPVRPAARPPLRGGTFGPPPAGPDDAAELAGIVEQVGGEARPGPEDGPIGGAEGGGEVGPLEAGAVVQLDAGDVHLLDAHASNIRSWWRSTGG